MRYIYSTDRLCPAGEHCVMWWEVSVRQHLQLQHQHVRSLLQMLQGDGAAAALGAALLQWQRHLGQLHHPGAHWLLLPVVLNNTWGLHDWRGMCKLWNDVTVSCGGASAGRDVVLQLILISSESVVEQTVGPLWWKWILWSLDCSQVDQIFLPGLSSPHMCMFQP